MPFLKGLQDQQYGVWARWCDSGHTPNEKIIDRRTIIPGGFYRFKRNELYPVFLNRSTDQNCGQRGETNLDRNGAVNIGLDWASALHSLELKDEMLVDTAQQLAVTFKADKDCTTQLGFRRVQAFKPAAGATLKYQNLDAANGSVLQEGSVTVPATGIWVIDGVKMLATGNRVVVTVGK
jgi:hypothetical protein